MPVLDSLKKEVNELHTKVKDPIKLNWEDAFQEAIVRFREHHTEEDKQKVKLILSRLIDRVEFRKKPFSVKVFYKAN